MRDPSSNHHARPHTNHAYHALAIPQTENQLQADATHGLATAEALNRTQTYGPNALPNQPPVSYCHLLLQQFDDLLVKILLAAAAVSLALAFADADGFKIHALVEPSVILTILVLNAIVGVWQESNAEQAIEALKQYEPNDAEVQRDGAGFRTVEATLLVPGDLIRVRAGDRVPADARLVGLDSTTLCVDQSVLTGESEAVLKDPEAVLEAGVELHGRHNMVYSGTTVSYGSARALVVATGTSTQIGLIGAQVSATTTAVSPLKRKLDEFGELLSKVIAAICVTLWLINISHFSDPAHGSTLRGAIYYFKIAIALAVAAIPEGLPAVVTTCLALGTRRMAAKNAIVRHLPSVETLGTTSVICSDKTGTITTNQMSAVAVLVADDRGAPRLASSDATGYDPTRHPLRYGAEPLADAELAAEPLRTLGAVCALCNHAHIAAPAASGDADGVSTANKWSHTGEPTEAALRSLAEKVGVAKVPRADAAEPERASTQWARSFGRLATLEFTRERKSMSVLCRPTRGGDGGGAYLAGSDAGGSGPGQLSLFVKGAPDALLPRCTQLLLPGGRVEPMTVQLRAAFEEAVGALAGSEQALRCLVCAVRHDVPDRVASLPLSDPARFAELESGLTLVGVAGLRDPPRLEVLPAVRACERAGIRVIVVTGDNLLTATAVARGVGLVPAAAAAPDDVEGEVDLATSKGTITGREFAALPAEKQLEGVGSISLFARTEPLHKLRLVELLQQRGEVVAMTGDGVNDAPALKKANIGIGMGSGTAVAKGAADMVLADDNFATIVTAIEEGRAIFANTKAFIRYLISSNIGEVVCIFLTAALGMPESLVPVQLLWVNLVTDGLPATALSFNPPDKVAMQQPPRPLHEPIVDRVGMLRYAAVGLYVGVATVLGFAYWFLYYAAGPQLTYWQLTHWSSCSAEWGVSVDCAIFRDLRPKTVALSVLVTIEMFNALNALSERESLVAFPPWRNWWLVGAIALSLLQHVAILFFTPLQGIFCFVWLTADEWLIVLLVSAPVVLLDEAFKLYARVQARQGGVSSGSSLRRADYVAVLTEEKAE